MDDLTDLYKAILAHPAENTPRRMFADALEERGQEHDAPFAEFIRLQIDLAENYQPRWSVTAMLTTRGPDYFDLETDTTGIQVGDRVDVVAPSDVRRYGVRQWPRYGLLVMKVLGSEGQRLSLKRDECSVPFPVTEANALTARITAVWNQLPPLSWGVLGVIDADLPKKHLAADWPLVAPQWFLQRPTGYPIFYTACGFVSSWRGTLSQWIAGGKSTPSYFPLTDVYFDRMGDAVDEILWGPDTTDLGHYRKNWPTVTRWHFAAGD